MVLLNTTFCITPPDSETFLRWATEVYIPAVKCIENHNCKFLRINKDSDECLSFAIQFTLGDEASAQQWINRNLNQLVAQAFRSGYGLTPDRLLHFSTIMDIIL